MIGEGRRRRRRQAYGRLFRFFLGVAAVAAIPALMFQMSWVNWTGFAYNAMLWCLLGLVDGASLVQGRSKAPFTSPA